MIFPNLRYPGARPGPQSSRRLPALLKLPRVLSRWRHHQQTAIPEFETRDVYGSHTVHAADPVVEAST
jgi:hypothetical protein